MPLDDTPFHHGEGSGGDDDPHHNHDNMKALANMMTELFTRFAGAAELCPTCAMTFVLGKMAGYMLWQMNDETPEAEDDRLQGVFNLCARVAPVALLEWKRLTAKDGKSDGPMPIITD